MITSKKKVAAVAKKLIVNVEHDSYSDDTAKAIRKALQDAGRQEDADAVAIRWFEGNCDVERLEELFGVKVIEAKLPKPKFKKGDVVVFKSMTFLVDDVDNNDGGYDVIELWPSPGDTDVYGFGSVFEKGNCVGTRGDISKLFADMKAK